MLRLLLAIFLLIPLPVLADHVPTQAPYDISISCDADGDTTKGDITVTWQESDGFESSPPERYAIAFSNDNFVETNYAVANSTGWEEALSYKSYVFTASYRETIFGTTADTFYAKVRADNDTDASYSEWTSVVSIDCDYGSTPTTTTTTSTTTTTTTVPPKPEPEPEPYVEPEPLPPPPEEIIVDIVVEGVDKTYTQADVNDGTIERDQERIDNENKFGCFMTNAQIERGDCKLPEEEPKEEVIIVVDEERDTKEELFNDDVVVPEVELEDEVEDIKPIKEEDIVEEEFEIDVKELEEKFKFEEENFVLEIIIIEEDIDEEVEEITEEVLDEPIQKDVEEVLEDELYEEIPGDDIIREETIQEEDVKDQVVQEVKELTEEEIAVEVAEIEEVVEFLIVEEDATEEEVAEAIEKYVEELETEEVIEVLEEVNDVGVQNLKEVSEEVQEVIQAVVEKSIEDIEELTEEQIAVVAEVLQVQEDDVEIIAEAVKEDEAVAKAVEEYVERAVENADVENYTLADVVTEVQYENFLENPIETFVDLDFEGITISNIGDDMTQDQKEKAQEVVVPVILTRIATMAAFVFRRSL